MQRSSWLKNIDFVEYDQVPKAVASYTFLYSFPARQTFAFEKDAVSLDQYHHVHMVAQIIELRTMDLMSLISWSPNLMTNRGITVNLSPIQTRGGVGRI